MRIKVKVDDRVYEVEVGDLHSRPIVAQVDGETFEVWPEAKVSYTTTIPSIQSPGKVPVGEISQSPSPTSTTMSSQVANDIQSKGSKVIRAPIPGVITAVLVKPGEVFAVGQELCKLEAMKMNNSIRASTGGKIESIHVSVGQQVKHSDILIEYSAD